MNQSKSVQNRLLTSRERHLNIFTSQERHLNQRKDEAADDCEKNVRMYIHPISMTISTVQFSSCFNFDTEPERIGPLPSISRVIVVLVKMSVMYG